MPFRAFCSFLRCWRFSKRDLSLPEVSMPFRAFCSFLHRILATRSLRMEFTGLNALPGILFFSTLAVIGFLAILIVCLNALPGILFFSTVLSRQVTPFALFKSQCPSGHFVLFYAV